MSKIYIVTDFARCVFYNPDGTTYHRWLKFDEFKFDNLYDAIQQFELWDNIYLHKATIRSVEK